MDRINPDIPSWGFARRAVTSTTTVVAADRGYTIDATSGTYDVALTAATTLGAGFVFGVYNSGAGVVTINPSGAETIRSPAGSDTTLALSQGQGVLVLCDGAGFEVVASAGLPPSPGSIISGLTTDRVVTAASATTIQTPASVTTTQAWAFSSTLAVVDGNLSITGSADATKLIKFEVDAQTTGDTLTINTGAQTDSRTLSVPVLTGNRTLAVIDQAQTFSAAQAITQPAITDPAYALNVSTTWNDAADTFGAARINADNAASGDSSLLLDLQLTSVSKFAVGKQGETRITKDNFGTSLSTLGDAALRIENGGTQSMLIFSFSSTPIGGVRADSSGNLNWHATGSQGHQFYKSLDTSLPVASIGGNGVKVGGPAGAVSTTAAMELPASTTSVASLNLPHGAAPSSPVDGDMWTTSAGLFVRISGVTIGPLS